MSEWSHHSRSCSFSRTFFLLHRPWPVSSHQRRSSACLRQGREEWTGRHQRRGQNHQHSWALIHPRIVCFVLLHVLLHVHLGGPQRRRGQKGPGPPLEQTSTWWQERRDWTENVSVRLYTRMRQIDSWKFWLKHVWLIMRVTEYGTQLSQYTFVFCNIVNILSFTSICGGLPCKLNSFFHFFWIPTWPFLAERGSWHFVNSLEHLRKSDVSITMMCWYPDKRRDMNRIWSWSSSGQYFTAK